MKVYVNSLCFFGNQKIKHEILCKQIFICWNYFEKLWRRKVILYKMRNYYLSITTMSERYAKLNNQSTLMHDVDEEGNNIE